MTVPTPTELEGLLERATPTVEAIRHWPATEEHSERYTVAGIPCGYPVASFGDAHDAVLFVEAKRALPALLARIKELSVALEQITVFEAGENARTAYGMVQIARAALTLNRSENDVA